MRKTYIIQAMDKAGAMLMDLRLDTRKGETLAMREAFQACQRNGGGFVRRQTEGAAGWAVYEAAPFKAFANLVTGPEKAEALARFEAWLATGGAQSAVDLIREARDGDDCPILWQDCAPPYREELTPAGLQLCIPGTERIPPDNGKPAQLSLFP